MYIEDPRDVMIGLVEDEWLDCKEALLMCVKFLSHDELRELFRVNGIDDMIENYLDE